MWLQFYNTFINTFINDDRLRVRLDSEMEPETHLELLGCKDDSLQEDEEAERGHTGWERTEAGHDDKTTRSFRRILDPSPEGDRRKTSLASPHTRPAANK